MILAGLLTASVAFLVDIAEASVSDWKEGYCSAAVYADKRNCCRDSAELDGDGCAHWVEWSEAWGWKYGIYVAIAVVYGLLAGAITLTTKSKLPESEEGTATKYMYMARCDCSTCCSFGRN